LRVETAGQMRRGHLPTVALQIWVEEIPLTSTVILTTPSYEVKKQGNQKVQARCRMIMMLVGYAWKASHLCPREAHAH